MRGVNFLGGGAALTLFAAGTASSLLSKVLYQLQGPGLDDGKLKHFDKPWFATLLMFLAMAACLPAAAVAKLAAVYVRRLMADGASMAPAGMSEPLLGLVRTSGGSTGSLGGAEAGLASVQAALFDRIPTPPFATPRGGTPSATPPGTPPRTPPRTPRSSAVDILSAAAPMPAGGPRALLLILIPTLFDLAATVLMSVGLLWIPTSVFQMTRGSEVIFSALLSTTFLSRRLNRWHLTGIMLCMAGISVVGVASSLGGASMAQLEQQHWQQQPLAEQLLRAVSPASMILLGMALVVLAEAVQAGQVVTEDLFMRGGMNMAPITVVGFEGVFGALLMLCVMLPVVQLLPGREGGGLHEDAWDTMHMLAHSRQLRVAVALSVVAMALYNVAGMAVTDSMGAVTRTVLETVRTLFVWVLNLLLFYANPVEGAKLGEPWTAHSWLQAIGFAVLVGGTLVYGHGEEVQERRLRARLRWARLRASLAALIPARVVQQPLRPARIAGPSTIRAVLVEQAVVGALRERLGERGAAPQAGSPSMATPLPAVSDAIGSHAPAAALPASRPVGATIRAQHLHASPLPSVRSFQFSRSNPY